MKKRDTIGWGLDSERIDLAHFSCKGKKLILKGIKQVELPQPINDDVIRQEDHSSGQSHSGQSDPDDIFGISSEPGSSSTSRKTSAESEEELDEINLDDLDLTDDVDLDDLELDDDLDMVEEADLPDTNEQLVYETMIAMNTSKKVDLGLNIPSGSTHLHVETMADYSSQKPKEIREVIREKLLKVHGTAISADSYSYDVDKEGRLWIASLDGEPLSLDLFNQVLTFSKRKRLIVRDILPDEIALIGLYRLNYPIDPDQERMTALIQFREHRSRIIFMQDHRIVQISQIINEGIADRTVLNTIFSKILFQLDTGDVPGLDRVILCDNRLGNRSVQFFQDHFPGVEVSTFRLDPYHFDLPTELGNKVEESTTALAMGVAASGLHDDYFPSLSIIPAYVYDRQKFFRLQWHGIMLLVLIGLTPIALNYLYQQNQQQIQQLQAKNQQLTTLIQQLQQPIAEIEQMEVELEAYQQQLMLMHDLTEGTVRWTATLNHLHEGLNGIGGIWITSFRHDDQNLILQGISLTENRIPMLARHFSRATLNQVQRDELRERDVYRFQMTVREALHDQTLYTPEQSREIPQFLESLNEF